MVVRLVVADSSTMVRVGYAAAVSTCADLELVGAAGTAEETRTGVAELRPDVVVLDAQLPDTDGFALARALREEQPNVGIVLVGPKDDDLLFKALSDRMSAYLPRNSSLDMVIAAVRHAAAAPASFTAPDLAGALARRNALRIVLSPREAEVLQHLRAGRTNASIASSLSLTESTVRTYLNRVYDKLGVRGRDEALVAAAQRGLLV